MTWTLAASVTEQIEKYGAYVGIASFFGLAALSLLYFSQARELKRLRDWAGRAPERAAELEARVVASAQSRRVQPHPAARPAATTPVTQAGKSAAAVAQGGPPSTPPPAAGTAVAEPPGQQGTPAPAAPSTGAGKPGEPPGDKSAAPAAPPGEGAAPAPAPSAAAAATGAAPPSASPAADIEPTQEVAALEPEGPREEAPAGNGAPPVAAPPPLPPRRPAPARRPAPPPRRPAPVAARAEERSGRGPLLPILAGVFALAVAIFAATQIFGGEEEAPPRNTVATGQATPAAEETPAGETETGGAGLSREETKISVFNGTTVPGLAAQTAEKLVAAGFPKPLTGNNPDQQRSATLVLYASPEARKSAQEVARLLKVSDPQRMDERARLQAGPEADVVVIVGSDQSQT